MLIGVGVSVVAIQTPAAGPWCYPQQPFQVIGVSGTATRSCEGFYSGPMYGNIINTRGFRATVTIQLTVPNGGWTRTYTLEPWRSYRIPPDCISGLVALVSEGQTYGCGYPNRDMLTVTNISLTLTCKPNCGYDSSPPPPTYPAETAPNYHPSVSYANLYYVATFGSAPGKMGSTVVGYLYGYPSNYVFCKKEWGVTTGPYGYNKWWLYTDLDTGGRGWVSAYYLSNYGNNEAYANGGGTIPNCP